MSEQVLINIVIVTSSLVSCLFVGLAYFSIGLFVLLLIYRRSLCILHTDPFFAICCESLLSGTVFMAFLRVKVCLTMFMALFKRQDFYADISKLIIFSPMSPFCFILQIVLYGEVIEYVSILLIFLSFIYNLDLYFPGLSFSSICLANHPGAISRLTLN